jgi:hypothetical protein
MPKLYSDYLPKDFIKERITLVKRILKKGNYEIIDLPEELQNKIGVEGHLNGLEWALDKFNISKKEIK